MRKQVMTRAWEIAKEGVKRFGGKVKEFFQQALIMAWEEVKGVVKMTVKDIKDLVLKARDETGAYDYQWNKWTKEGHNRIYINLVFYRKHRKRTSDCGYIDLNKNEYVAYSNYSTEVFDLVAQEKMDTRKNEARRYEIAK